MGNPAEFFTKIWEGAAKDKDGKVQDSFEVATYTPSWGNAEDARKQMTAFLEQKGVKTGRMTKSLFIDYNAYRAFTSVAKDKDSKLTKADADKLQKNPRAWGIKASDDFAKIDKDGDGSLTLAEYTEYFQAKMSEGRTETASTEEKSKSPSPPPARPAGEVDERAIVYRYGNLPKGIPDWFTSADKDKDGQVSLVEWRAAGKPTAEFRKLDMNNDGLITAEEWLRGKRVQDRAAELAKAIASGSTVASLSTPSSSSVTRPDSSSETRRPGMMKGKKGKKGRPGS